MDPTAASLQAQAQAGAGQAPEPKGQLNQFCQRYCKRPVAKEDVVYSTAQYGEAFQSTVTVNCIEGQQFVGETAATQKEAEKAAAAQALIHFQPLSDSLPPTTSKNKKKRPATELTSGSLGMHSDEPALKALKTGGQGMEENPALTFKVLLNTVCMKLLKRPMTKNEISYETNQTPGGYQSMVKLPCLPGEWGELAWAGEVASDKKQAEQNAAKEAVQQVNQDLDGIKALLPQAPPKQPSSCGKGRGKGKDKGGFGKGCKGKYGGGCDFWGMKGMMGGMGGMDMGMGKGGMPGMEMMGMGMGMPMMGMGGMGGWS